jgi:translation initiation factor 1
MKEKKRIPVSDETAGWSKPFASLGEMGFQSSPAVAQVTERKEPGIPAPAKNRGRVDILRQTAHRGGKTVTVVKGFVGVGHVELKELGRELQKACGAGGTVKDGRIEIQGDHRDVVARILKDAGFRPVLAGG